MSLINNLEDKYNHKYNDFYNDINDRVITRKEKGFDWNNRCYVASGAVLDEFLQDNADIKTIATKLEDSAIVASLCGWIANNRKIIKVDELREERILRSKYKEIHIDVDEIFKKIDYGTYLECNMKPLRVFSIDADGVLLSIENNLNTEKLELRAFVVCKNGKVLPFYLRLEDKKTLKECVMKTLGFVSDNVEEYIENCNSLNISIVKSEFTTREKMHLLTYSVFDTVLHYLEY